MAELCNPDWVSVPLEAWSLSQALREVAEVHLVTRAHNRPNLLTAGLREGEDFTAVGDSRVDRAAAWAEKTLRGGKSVGWSIATALGSLTYPGFERRLWHQLGPRLRRGDFDLVHRLTPVSPAVPSPIASRCRRMGIPFVLGPLNGGVPWPPGFPELRRGEREWLAPLRPLHRLLPAYLSTRRDATAIIAGSRTTLAEVPRAYRDRCVYVPENGVDRGRFSQVVEGEARLPVKVAFVGRHVRLKGIDLLLEAAAPLLLAGKIRLDLIGDGPETPRLRAMAAAQGLLDSAAFPGWVPHAELQARLVQSDLLGFPSLREFGGGVVLEAMSLGLVPVVLDYGGPAELVSPATGFAVPMGRREEIVARLKSILERITDDPKGIRPMGRRARRRALGLFAWEAKARQILEVYCWATGATRQRPDFGMPLPDPPGV